MSWHDKVKEYCEFYNIPLEFLADTLYEPKVVPMIRGKAFEFSALIALREVLPPDEFEVTKEAMNAQLDSHDIDIAVKHIPTGIDISVECKLAGKGDITKLRGTDNYKLRVKCMRSRTLGDNKAELQATKLNLNPDQLKAHADSYLPRDFDIVLTSIGNIFYVTRQDGIFSFEPDEAGLKFLQLIAPENEYDNLKDFAFKSLYVAHSYDLAVRADNDIKCTRRKCNSTSDCGFIPNYPNMYFNQPNKFSDTPLSIPDHPWYKIDDAVSVFRRIAQFKMNHPNLN